jgi:hypothetical protein
VKPIKRIISHPQLPNHFLIEFEDGTKNIASTAKLEQLKLLHLVEPKSKTEQQ